MSNAVIVISVPEQVTTSIFDYFCHKVKLLYLCNRVVVLSGLQNNRDTIEASLKDIGPSVATIGKVYVAENDILLSVHSPAFDQMREALSDLYLLRAFPRIPCITISRDILYFDDVDVNVFSGVTFPVNKLTISDAESWYEYDYDLPVVPRPPDAFFGCSCDSKGAFGCEKQSVGS